LVFTVDKSNGTVSLLCVVLAVLFAVLRILTIVIFSFVYFSIKNWR